VLLVPPWFYKAQTVPFKLSATVPVYQRLWLADAAREEKQKKSFRPEIP
jgi:hypothetical protein